MPTYIVFISSYLFPATGSTYMIGTPSTTNGGSPTGGQQQKLSLIHVWAVGVGSAIGGNFLGWNSCLQAGLGGASIGLILSFCLYMCLCLCIAEMSAQTKFRVSGAHSFVADR